MPRHRAAAAPDTGKVPARRPAQGKPAAAAEPELVIITGLSGSGKGSTVKETEIDQSDIKRRVIELVNCIHAGSHHAN